MLTLETIILSWTKYYQYIYAEYIDDIRYAVVWDLFQSWKEIPIKRKQEIEKGRQYIASIRKAKEDWKLITL